MNNEKFNINIPLLIGINPKTKSSMDCWLLILTNCIWKRNFKNIQISKEDRKFLNLSRISYIRGIKELERIGWIKVKREAGKLFKISILVVPETKELCNFIVANDENRNKIIDTWDKLLQKDFEMEKE